MQVFSFIWKSTDVLRTCIKCDFGKFLILFGTIEGPTVTIKCNKYFGAHLTYYTNIAHFHLNFNQCEMFQLAMHAYTAQSEP